MEATIKINVAKLRKDIKETVKNQKDYKEQRKTVRFSGKRTMQPWEAAMKHYHNRKDLSVMYATLLVLRGWSEDEAAKNHISKKGPLWDFDFMKNKIQKVLELYKEEKE